MGQITKFALRYAKVNLGVKKVSAPSKNPKKCHIICFAPDKSNNLMQDFQNQRNIGIFMSLRERKREREREREGERKREREREREREKKSEKEKGR